MSKQLHKNFTNGQVKSLLEKYSKGEIKLNYILQILRIISGFRTDWSGPVTERILGTLKKPNLS